MEDLLFNVLYFVNFYIVSFQKHLFKITASLNKLSVNLKNFMGGSPKMAEE